jgi:hypothetical protein
MKAQNFDLLLCYSYVKLDRVSVSVLTAANNYSYFDCGSFK